MAVPNLERYPEPAQRPAEKSKGADSYKWDPINVKGVEPQTAGVINEALAKFNERFGTDVKPRLTAIPFENKQEKQ